MATADTKHFPTGPSGWWSGSLHFFFILVPTVPHSWNYNRGGVNIWTNKYTQDTYSSVKYITILSCNNIKWQCVPIQIVVTKNEYFNTLPRQGNSLTFKTLSLLIKTWWVYYIFCHTYVYIIIINSVKHVNLRHFLQNWRFVHRRSFLTFVILMLL